MARKQKQTAAAAPPADALAYIAADLRNLALPIEMLVFDPKNARQHAADSVQAIKASLARYGQRKPVIFNQTSGYLEAGHGTVMAARELGWPMLAVVRVEDDPQTATGFAIADNRSAELSRWDDAALRLALEDIKSAESDLYDTLLLVELEAGSAPPPAKAEVQKRFGVSVELDTEDQQKGLFARLKREGYRVKLTKYDVRVDSGGGEGGEEG